MKPANVGTFKFLMVGSFVLVNVLRLSSFWYRFACGFVTNATAPTPISPFKVAASGLNDIYESTRLWRACLALACLPLHRLGRLLSHGISRKWRPW